MDWKDISILSSLTKFLFLHLKYLHFFLQLVHFEYSFYFIILLFIDNTFIWVVWNSRYYIIYLNQLLFLSHELLLLVLMYSHLMNEDILFYKKKNQSLLSIHVKNGHSRIYTSFSILLFTYKWLIRSFIQVVHTVISWWYASFQPTIQKDPNIRSIIEEEGSVCASNQVWQNGY